MKIILLSLFTLSLFARGTISANRFEQLSGRKVKPDEKVYWNRRYDKSSYVFGKAPETFLSYNYHYIPAGSKVLDIAMGEGRHAVYLAKKGYKVTGIDISSVAVKKAKLLAREYGARIQTIVASLENYEFPPESFDAIICFYYLDRKLNEKMIKWLKKDGILIFENYTTRQKTVKGFEHHSINYLLQEGEILNLFPGNRVLKYEEPLHKTNFTTSIIIKKGL